MTWNQLDLYSGILSEFAEHASLAHDREWDRETDRAALLAERRRFQRRYAVDPETNREAVRRCIAKKTEACDESLRKARREAAARWYAQHYQPRTRLRLVQTCSVAECGDHARKAGMCERHYLRMRRAGGSCAEVTIDRRSITSAQRARDAQTGQLRAGGPAP